MAREGIYVGGKEIIQRYVGDRLVWEKVRFELVGTFFCYMVKNDQEQNLNISSVTGDYFNSLSDGVYYLKSREQGLKYPFVKTTISKNRRRSIKLSFDSRSDYVYGYYNWIPAGGIEPQEHTYVNIPFYRKIGG